MVACHSSKVAVGVQVPVTILLLIVSSARAEWVTIPSYRQSNISGALGDIFDHTPPKLDIEPSLYHDDIDKITSAHETTHLIHARLKIARKKDTFYLLKNRAFSTTSPKITLKQVADSVPEDKRGKVYGLYLVEQQKYWNDRPLYIIDELVAYINGTIVGLEINDIRRAKDSFNKVEEMWVYAAALQKLSQQSNFSCQKEFDEFMAFIYNDRVVWLRNQLE